MRVRGWETMATRLYLLSDTCPRSLRGVLPVQGVIARFPENRPIGGDGRRPHNSRRQRHRGARMVIMANTRPGHRWQQLSVSHLCR